jgi:hypothetical protein
MGLPQPWKPPPNPDPPSDNSPPSQSSRTWRRRSWSDGNRKNWWKKMGKPWRKSMKINDFIKSHWWWSNILEKRYEHIGISLDHCAVRFNQQLDHWDILILVALDLRVQSPCEATTKGQTDKAGIGNGMEIACQLAMWKIAFYSPDRNLSMNHTDSYRSYQY